VTSDLPGVDVIIPTMNRPELLGKAITAALDQDYAGAVRVLVVYDGTEPDLSLERSATAEQGSAARSVTVLSNQRKPGLAGGRNTGIEAATAELVAFCDDDDRWLPGKLAAQVAALAAAPDAALVSCGIRIQYEDHSTDRTLGDRRVTLHDLLADRLTELHPSTFVMRRNVLVAKVGLVEEDLPGSYAEDYELLLRAARLAPVVTTAEIGVEVLWGSQSYFDSRWAMIVQALTWLLDRYPEFASVPVGEARIDGQIAFASAAMGARSQGLRWAARSVRRNPAEKRAYLAAAVAVGVLPPDRVTRWLHARGRGI
jgi:glycosyltransferase involved in cell wall biosynthesis